MPYFAWNFLTAFSVAVPKKFVSLPDDPTPLEETRVSGSEFKSFCRRMTSAFSEPLESALVNDALTPAGLAAGAAGVAGVAAGIAVLPNTSSSFARVLGPTNPKPSEPGPAMPYFSWNFFTALSVAGPNVSVSLPEEPAPDAETFVSGSEFRSTCKRFTSSPFAPLTIPRENVAETAALETPCDESAARAASALLSGMMPRAMKRLMSCESSAFELAPVATGATATAAGATATTAVEVKTSAAEPPQPPPPPELLGLPPPPPPPQTVVDGVTVTVAVPSRFLLSASFDSLAPHSKEVVNESGLAVRVYLSAEVMTSEDCERTTSKLPESTVSESTVCTPETFKVTVVTLTVI